MDKTMQMAISAAAAAAFSAARTILDGEKKSVGQKDKPRDPRLRNTKMLLRRYRELREHASKAIYDAQQIGETDDDIARLMRSVAGDVEFRIESIQRSASRTALMMLHIDRMLEVWKASCFRSGRAEDQRCWRVVYSVYLAPREDAKSIDAVAKEEHIDPRTVYRDIDAAAEVLSAYFFGVDGALE